MYWRYDAERDEVLWAFEILADPPTPEQAPFCMQRENAVIIARRGGNHNVWELVSSQSSLLSINTERQGGQQKRASQQQGSRREDLGVHELEGYDGRQNLIKLLREKLPEHTVEGDRITLYVVKYGNGKSNVSADAMRILRDPHGNGTKMAFGAKMAFLQNGWLIRGRCWSRHVPVHVQAQAAGGRGMQSFPCCRKCRVATWTGCLMSAHGSDDEGQKKYMQAVEGPMYRILSGQEESVYVKAQHVRNECFAARKNVELVLELQMPRVQKNDFVEVGGTQVCVRVPVRVEDYDGGDGYSFTWEEVQGQRGVSHQIVGSNGSIIVQGGKHVKFEHDKMNAHAAKLADWLLRKGVHVHSGRDDCPYVNAVEVGHSDSDNAITIKQPTDWMQLKKSGLQALVICTTLSWQISTATMAVSLTLRAWGCRRGA